ncbi:MAG: hypothetical protein RML35_08725 [Chloroherpetonaceae bacterium]|nr:hypothetical protein [Chloroherpetonaceae bacterium]
MQLTNPYFVVRIGRFYFGILSEYVRKALPVIPHIEVPLLKPHFGGIVLYSKRFIAKLFLDSVLDIGLYRQSKIVTTDSTVIFEVQGVTFCATVNEVMPVTLVEQSKILPIEQAPESCDPIFPKKDYLLGFFEERQKHVYIVDMERVFRDSFAALPQT